MVDHQLDVSPFTKTLGPARQPVFYPGNSTSVQVMSCQFVQENAGEMVSEALLNSG